MFYKLYCRLYQGCFRVASAFLPWREPKLIKGENSIKKLPEVIRSLGLSNVLIVTGAELHHLGLLDGLYEALKSADVAYSLFADVVPNPTIDNVEAALKMYHDNRCQGIIAFGGGSAMDCAKCVGARIARPNKTVKKMKGELRVLKKLPPLFAIPTTAGTGSETTLAAVIRDDKTSEKYSLNDPALIPLYAVLDPVVTAGLPPHITSTTGMDALTHAVESYIGHSGTAKTKEHGRRAAKLVYENLYAAYKNGNDMNARVNMQEAAYLAGVAFTRAYVGNIHAVAHTLGGFYNYPHGLANAIIMPYVLEYYGKTAWKPLAELAEAVGVGGENEKEKAENFIKSIRDLNKIMEIESKVDCIKKDDVPLMIKRALREANPLYPVPMIFGAEDMQKIYDEITEG